MDMFLAGAGVNQDIDVDDDKVVQHVSEKQR